MRVLDFLCISGLFFLTSTGLIAQGRKVAITVDDLPYAGGDLTPPLDSQVSSTARTANRRLLAAFKLHHVPVTGFVIENRLESLGSAQRTRILKEWTGRGFDLGNHTYSHSDMNDLSVEQIEQEIVRGESTIGPLMNASGKKLSYFRFPMNHTGDTKVKHDAIAAFLSQRGYRLATCTIDTSDYLFNDAYIKMLARNDGVAAQRLRAEYLAYTNTEIDYYATLSRQVLGYEPPQVMLLHDNRLNADVIEQVLHFFEVKQYQFVSLDAAQADAAYRTPDTYITRFGPMWEYRWAQERSIKVNGTLETEPPKWIFEYGKEAGQVTP